MYNINNTTKMFTTPSNILTAEVGAAVIQGANCYARYVQHINYFQKLSQAWWRQLSIFTIYAYYIIYNCGVYS